MTRPGIEPWSPGALVNTLLIWPMGNYLKILSKQLNSALSDPKRVDTP